MNPQRTEQLIETLARDLESTRVVMSPLSVSSWWYLATLVWVVSCLFWLGPFREGWLDQVQHHPRLLVELVTGLGAGFTLALYGFVRAVPGGELRFGLLASVAMLGVFIGSIAAGLVGYPALEPSMGGKRMTCIWEALLVSLPPLVGAIVLIRRRFPLQPVHTLAPLAIATMILPATVMHVACMYDPTHILLSHVLPAIIAAAAATVLVMRSGLATPASSIRK